MGFPVLEAIPIIGKLIDKILDKTLKNKVDDATMEEVRRETQQMLMSEGREELQQFYDFIINYEGAAADHGKFIQWLRGSVRPILTYTFAGYLIYIIQWWLMGMVDPDADITLAVKLIFGLNGLTLGFWFGERALKNIGLHKMLAVKS